MGCASPPDDEVINQFIACSGQSNDQSVDLCEIHWTLRKYFRNIPMRVSAVFAKFADSDCNGQISRKEFNRFISILNGVDANDEQVFYQLIFKASDLNENGIMEQNELQFVFQKLNVQVKDDSVYGNCPLTLSEFIQLMKKMKVVEKTMAETTDVLADYSVFKEELKAVEQDDLEQKVVMKVV